MSPHDSSAPEQGPHEDHDPDPDPDPVHARASDQADPAQLQRTNTFSLAGRPTYDPPAYFHRTDSYIQPQYRTYQEPYEYERPPIWGLAGPLPRTVRPGMRPRRASDAQTLPDNAPTRRNIEDAVRHVQSNVSHQPAPARLPRRLSVRRPTISRPPPTEAIQEDEPPTYRLSEDRPETPAAEPVDAASPDVSHLSRKDLLKAVAANAWHQHEDSHADDEHTSGQVQQEISNHASHDFATESQPRPVLAPIQEVPRPSLIDKPEIEELRKRLQAQADFVPHRSRSICRPPTEYDLEVPQPRHFSHFRKSPSRGTLRRRSRSRSRSTVSRRSSYQPNPDQRFLNQWSKYRHQLREPLAEFLGVFVMMFCGLAANLMSQINRTVNPAATPQWGDLNSTYLAWSWSCMAAIYIAGGVSGAHLSPIVTITLCIFRGFPWRHIWKYALAQFLGCFSAALLVYGLYRDAITITSQQTSTDAFEALFATSSVFHSTPTTGVGNATVFFSQAVMVALFSLTVLALGDDRNAPPGAGMNAFIVGLFVFVICAAFPYNTGASFNPFRDLAPRLVVTMVWPQHGLGIWSFRGGYWFWGCWVAPLVGSLLGAAVYDVCIFTGGESPVNYQEPGALLMEGATALKSRVGRLSCRGRGGGGGRSEDEEMGGLPDGPKEKIVDDEEDDGMEGLARS